MDDVAKSVNCRFGKAFQEIPGSRCRGNVDVTKDGSQGRIVSEILDIRDGIAAGKMVDDQRQNMNRFPYLFAMKKIQACEVLDDVHGLHKLCQQKNSGIRGNLDLFTLFDFEVGDGNLILGPFDVAVMLLTMLLSEEVRYMPYMLFELDIMFMSVLLSEDM